MATLRESANWRTSANCRELLVSFPLETTSRARRPGSSPSARVMP